MDRQYIGARYIPIPYDNPNGTNEWIPGAAYEALTIVIYGNRSYISKKPVPAHRFDNPGEDTEYWIKATIYNADVEEALESIAELEETKADKDGYYHNLYAGNIISDRKYTDSVPYLFRKTAGGTAKIGERENDTLVGATVNVNQLVQVPTNSITKTLNGVTITDNRDGSYTVVTDSSGATNNVSISLTDLVTFNTGHVYFLRGCPNGGGANTFSWNILRSAPDTGNGTIYNRGSLATNAWYPAINVNAGMVITTPIMFRPNCIDLTAMLGSTIADYLYSLETATAGAGVAKLREWGFFTDEYIPYNAGTLESVEATAHVMRDVDDNIIGNYDLGTDTLLGLFKLDNENRLYADGDTKTSDGTVTRKYSKIVIDGSVGTITKTATNRFNVDGTQIEYTRRAGYMPFITNGTYEPLAENATNAQFDTSAQNYSKAISLSASSYTIRFKDTSIDTIDDFKNYLSANPVTIVYELATPTTEQSTPFTNPQICDPDGTEEYVTNNGIPVGHETKYDYDIKGLAEELIDVPDVPSTNGTYVLKATRSENGLSYNWIAE